MSESNLLPCPFCGGKSNGQSTVNVTETARSGPRFGVRCYFCGARVEFFETRAEAIAAWNTRSVTAAAVMGYEAAQAERTCRREKHGTKMDGSPKLRCSLCGYGVGDKRWKFCPNCGAKVVEQ